MQIDLSAKLTEKVSQYIEVITADSKKALFSASAKLYGEWWGITLQTFFECSIGDFSSVFGNITYKEQPTCGEYVWMLGFQSFLEEFKTTMEGLSLQQTPQEKEAEQALLPMTLEESMRVFCQRYFNLPSFKATDTLTMEEYLIARKADYNHAAFERKLGEIERREMKRKH